MLRMIIVDDEYIILESLKNLIDWESIGVQVVGSADNGTAAIDLTLKQHPDIILSDISMPLFNGLEMLETLRKNNVAAEVIFISAYGKFEYARDALKHGAFDYILKPINEEQLLKTVKRCADKIIKNKSAFSSGDDWAQNIQNGESEFYGKITSIKLDKSASFESERHELLKAIKAADADAADSRLLRIFVLINLEDDILDADAVKLQCVELLDFILRELKDYKLQDYLENTQKTLSAKKSITAGIYLDDVFNITSNILCNIALCVKEILANSSKRLITTATAYIQEYYKEDITLSKIAEQLYISPTYLGCVDIKTRHRQSVQEK